MESQIPQHSEKRGQYADRPIEIPKKGWKDIAKRVRKQLKYDHVQVVSAGVAFYFFLALFPAIVMIVTIYGLIMDPADVEYQIIQIASALPEKAYEMISDVMKRVIDKTDNSLGWGLLFSILISLWSANRGTSALFEGLNIVYNERNDRNFFIGTGLTLLITLGSIIFGFLAISLIVGYTAFVDDLPLSPLIKNTISWLRWPLLGTCVFFVLGFIYKIAPHRNDPEFKWVSWGSLIATVLWLLGSMLFTLYVNNFNAYDGTYGSFAAVVILMMWFYLTAYVVLLGAEINSEMEHQTAQDTTIGNDEPLGQRGAYYADRVAMSDKKKDEKHFKQEQK